MNEKEFYRLLLELYGYGAEKCTCDDCPIQDECADHKDTTGQWLCDAIGDRLKSAAKTGKLNASDL